MRAMKLPWRLVIGAALAALAPRAWADEPLDAALAELAGEVGEGYALEVAAGCFVVASHLDVEAREQAIATIESTCRALYAEYLEIRPDRPVKVHLFPSGSAYRSWYFARYGKKPPTPYGLYRTEDRRILLDASSGLGTLAHELVHPLLLADFPAAPAWFNEGFASLFEESRFDEAGRIRGAVNFRLPGLQRALRVGQALPLADLLTVPIAEFHGEGAGLRYAQARFVCLWLQEKGLLLAYYRTFRGSVERDPTGRLALEAVTGQELPALEGEWRAWVFALGKQGR